MAKIEDLIRQVSDERLRNELASEVRELKKQKHFGLVFEEHLPEMLRLPKVPIRVGNVVAPRDGSGSDVWRVLEITGKKAKCRQPLNPTKYDEEVLKDFPLDELVLVVRFGEPIYPVLTPVDRVTRGGPDKPWHILINADNYHALQLLLYSHERKIDLIYIDPPYNTGARDWKYNNDYVDETDAWRHSKWLSMLRKRLLLASRLLKPSGVLAIAIDDIEFPYVSTLTQELFKGWSYHVIVTVPNPRGKGGANFSRNHEYMCVFVGPQGVLQKLPKSMAEPLARVPARSDYSMRVPTTRQRHKSYLKFPYDDGGKAVSVSIAIRCFFRYTSMSHRLRSKKSATRSPLIARQTLQRRTAFRRFGRLIRTISSGDGATERKE